MGDDDEGCLRPFLAQMCSAGLDKKVSHGGTAFYVACLLAFLLGAYLRLDQFLLQVLLDDEWHALHQVMANSPSQFLRSFGTADYSIPLTLLYWIEATSIGLSELGMRWPMMLSGLILLAIFPIWAGRRIGWSGAVIFAFLLAISPFLIYYSRNARPYGLTLLLVFVAHYAFWRAWQASSRRTRWTLLYAVSTALAAWLHLLTLIVSTAPFCLVLIDLAKRRVAVVDGMVRMASMALPAVLLVALLLLPPWLADPAALTTKTGSDMPTADTWIGLAHLWVGSCQIHSVIVLLALAIIGFPTLLRSDRLPGSVLLGVGLTILAVYLAKPAWVHNPLTLARYLLPGIVLMLLASATGLATVGAFIARRVGRWGFMLASAPVFVLLAFQTPLWTTQLGANSYQLHAQYQFDYRADRQAIRERMESDIPLSSWWSSLAQYPEQTLVVAVAPYDYFSPHWDGPRWERLSHQRVIPAYLTGLCVASRSGEVPNDSRFRMNNAVHLTDVGMARSRRIDWVVFQKPYQVGEGRDKKLIGADTAHCLTAIASHLGEPAFEDDKIAVFHPASAVPHDQQ